MFPPHRKPTFGHPEERPYDRADGFEECLEAQTGPRQDEDITGPTESFLPPTSTAVEPHVGEGGD